MMDQHTSVGSSSSSFFFFYESWFLKLSQVVVDISGFFIFPACTFPLPRLHLVAFQQSSFPENSLNIFTWSAADVGALEVEDVGCLPRLKKQSRIVWLNNMFIDLFRLKSAEEEKQWSYFCQK